MPTIDNDILLYVASVITAVGDHKVCGVRGRVECREAGGATRRNLLVQHQRIALVIAQLIDSRATTQIRTPLLTFCTFTIPGLKSRRMDEKIRIRSFWNEIEQRK